MAELINSSWRALFKIGVLVGYRVKYDPQGGFFLLCGACF